MLWINFLHLYQPANSEARHIEEATEKSYWRIVRALEEHPRTRFTLNISGCLILRWEDLGYSSLLERLSRLVRRGQAELVGSAAYHPLLPLIPEAEAERQILENEAILEKYFQVKPRGFFLPEMDYSPKAAKLVKKLGYEWLILDEISCTGKLGQAEPGRVYLDGNSGLKVLFRSREFSQSYIPEKLLKSDAEGALVTATDGELYGLRHEDPDAYFEKILKTGIKTSTISEFIRGKKPIRASLVPSTWESTEEELRAGRPFALWADKKNSIQVRLWKLAALAYETGEKFKRDENHYWFRWHLVRGLASCTFWWASAKDLKHVFGPISWGPDEIERGTNELVRAIRSLADIGTRPAKLRAEKLNSEIRKLVWERHWRKYWKKK